MNRNWWGLFVGLLTFPLVFSCEVYGSTGSSPEGGNRIASVSQRVANVDGTVTCEGRGIPGVEVSDGDAVTVTDAEGRYAFHSGKQNGYVFISIPSGYEVAEDGNRPVFFQYLTKDTATLERRDFSLTQVKNTHYVMLCFSDIHLANRNNDLQVFNSAFVPDINATIQRLEAEGTKVYGIALGDVTWDLYWYRDHFGLKDYLKAIQGVECPVFTVMGNHDNDPYAAANPADGTDADWNAALPFKRIVGPTSYSFNLGRTHYVVLDDIQYLNDGGAQGTVGARNYRNRIIDAQLAWLKKDLGLVADKSAPLVVAMHIPLYGNPKLDGQQQKDEYLLEADNAEALKKCLSGFSDVHIFSGHTHLDYNVTQDAHIYEHNTPAVCATWWWTSKEGCAGNMICKDGTPAGYGIYDFDGTRLTWQYKSLGNSVDYQFRAYDLNECHITAARFAPAVDESDVAPYVGEYGLKNDRNQVLINVWNYDPEWKVEVLENGISLPVVRVSAKDPLHLISYDLQRLNRGDQPTGAFVTNKTAHLFLTQASGPTTPLTIRVTDRFGRVYTQEMKRPKALSYTMK